ncbi:MAG: leucyl aminopeptidase [Microthrixaceae bacterium]
MSELLSVKISKDVPAGATAVAETVCSDSLNKVPGVRKAAMERSGFAAKVGQILVLDDGERSRVLVGVGPAAAVGAGELRTAAAVFTRAVGRHRRVGFAYPDGIDLEPGAGVRAVTEGLILGAYRFDAYKTDPSASPGLSAATIAVGDRVREVRDGAARGRAAAEAVCFARDLVNEPGGSLTPAVFAERAAERAVAAGLSAEIMDLDAMVAAGLGGVLAVNQGSDEQPRLLKLTYDPTATDEDTTDQGVVQDLSPEPDAVDTVALVGKGITFDSGGLSLKPAESMMEMKCDMAGAAAVIAAMCALADLDVAVRVVAFTPMTDNMTGGSAQRPGDVYTARNGTTVEVLNTDAEGRLVLADALSLAGDEEPDAIVDLATLTGACMVALGQKIAGLMGNDEVFCGVVEAAAEAAGERVWQLPLPADYRSSLDSSVADIKNIAGGRYGGTLTAGLFLKEFVDDATPWVHLDIAGPAFLGEADGVSPKGATGFGVRTLLTLLETWGDEMEIVEEVDEDLA